MNYRECNHHFPKEIRSWELADNRLNMMFAGAAGETFHGEFTFYQNGALRVRLYRDAFVPVAYDVTNEQSKVPAACKAEESAGAVAVAFGGYRAVFGKAPFSFRVEDENGAVRYEENMKDVNSVGDGLDQIPPMGYSTDEDGRIVCMNIGARLHPDEHIYGLGEHYTEFDKRGQQLAMRNFDTLGCRDANAYKNIPFYISSRRYGLFVHHHGVYDFNVGSESIATVSVHVPDTCLEYYLIFGGNMKEILSCYTNLTGPAALPPDWSFGLWYSTGFKGNSRANTEEDARALRGRKIPCDVMHFDCYWLRDDMWCDFVWDDAQYPGRVEMLKNLKAQGFKICLWINPYITVISDMYREGEEKGYLVKNRDGGVYTADLWHGLLPYCAMVDFTNPEAEAWYRGKVASVLKEGVDVLKTDFAEDIPYDSMFYNGMTGKQMRNIYSRLYNNAVFSEIKQQNGQGLVWARSGCAGMQQFPVCWSGDPYSSFEGMAGTLRGGLSLAMSGVPFWSHDMGGFYGDVSEEMYIRWSQFGLFSSHSRLHGTTTRQPWAYGDRACEIVTDFIRLRYRLMPYILKTAHECAEQGIPFLRPLVLEHDDDPAVYNIWDQYYFGSDLIVAPVFGGDNAERQVYLPAGDWVDLLNGREYEGGRWHKFTCPLSYMPILRRRETEIPMETEEKQFVE